MAIQEIAESLHCKKHSYSEPYKGSRVHQSEPLEWVTRCKDSAIFCNITHSKSSDWWTRSTLMFYLLQRFRNLLYTPLEQCLTAVFAPDEGLEAMLRLEMSSDVEITAFLSWEFSSSAKVPHLKLFICDVTGHPRSLANICHAPGLAQARPHDAMHLSSLEVI